MRRHPLDAPAQEMQAPSASVCVCVRSSFFLSFWLFVSYRIEFRF